MKRIQVLLDEEDVESFRQLARRNGQSLSAWLRAAGREKRAAQAGAERLGSRRELERFFDQCDRREAGREPDWQEHLEVMARSRLAGS